MPVRENGEGVKGRLPEPSDHNVSLTLREEGKKRKLGDALRLLCLSKERAVKALGSPGATGAVRDLCLPEMGLPLVFLL